MFWYIAGSWAAQLGNDDAAILAQAVPRGLMQVKMAGDGSLTLPEESE
jgi:hypothetical protein